MTDYPLSSPPADVPPDDRVRYIADMAYELAALADDLHLSSAAVLLRYAALDAARRASPHHSIR